MFLEMHDAEAPTLCAVVRNIEYMYQAEQHVIDACAEHQVLVLWLLFDAEGQPLRAWRRVSASEFTDSQVPEGTTPDPRSMRPRATKERPL